MGSHERIHERRVGGQWVHMNAYMNAGSAGSGFLSNKRLLYETGAVLVCSQRRAGMVVGACFAAIITAAVCVAFTKPGQCAVDGAVLYVASDLFWVVFFCCFF